MTVPVGGSVAAGAAALPARRRRGALAVVLVVAGLLLWLAYRLSIGGEHHSYAAGATPPADFALTAGKTYSIGVPGGVGNGLAPDALACEITTNDDGTRTLQVNPEPADSRALNQVATFVAPSTGRAAIRCTDLPAVYVDDADDADTDYAGLWLVLASIALAVGVPLLVSVARRAVSAPSSTESSTESPTES